MADDLVDAAVPRQGVARIEPGQVVQKGQRPGERVRSIGAPGIVAEGLVAERPSRLVLNLLQQRGQLVDAERGGRLGRMAAGKTPFTQRAFRLLRQLAKRSDRFAEKFAGLLAALLLVAEHLGLLPSEFASGDPGGAQV